MVRYAVIPTRDRPDDFQDCLKAIYPQVDHVFVVSHCAPYMPPARGPRVTIISYIEDPPNISRMWNLGLDAVHEHAAGRPYDVAVLNDDVVVPPDWFERVASWMHKSGASAGCVRRDFDPRLTGYAFILAGRDNLRADEQFQWWYGDDDLERQAGDLGGVAFVGGEDVEHRHPNSTTVGVLAEIASADRQRYARKWR